MNHTEKIAFQGVSGANSEIALKKYQPNSLPVPFTTFEDIFNALNNNEISKAFLPIENSIAGRVTDVHHLLPQTKAYIIGEHFEPIHHQLLALKEAELEDIVEVHSHIQALGQCRNFIKQNNLTPVTHHDTAGSASDVAKWQDKTKASIASALAGELYNLKILRHNIEDNKKQHYSLYPFRHQQAKDSTRPKLSLHYHNTLYLKKHSSITLFGH